MGSMRSSSCSVRSVPRRRRRGLVLRHQPTGGFLAAAGHLVTDPRQALRVAHAEDALALLLLACEPAAFEVVVVPCGEQALAG